MPSLNNILNALVVCCGKVKIKSECLVKKKETEESKCCLFQYGQSRQSSEKQSPAVTPRITTI